MWWVQVWLSILLTAWQPPLQTQVERDSVFAAATGSICSIRLGGCWAGRMLLYHVNYDLKSKLLLYHCVQNQWVEIHQ